MTAVEKDLLFSKRQYSSKNYQMLLQTFWSLENSNQNLPIGIMLVYWRDGKGSPYGVHELVKDEFGVLNFVNGDYFGYVREAVKQFKEVEERH